MGLLLLFLGKGGQHILMPSDRTLLNKVNAFSVLSFRMSDQSLAAIKVFRYSKLLGSCKGE